MTLPTEVRPLLRSTAAAAGGYTINNSLRLRSSAGAYLSRSGWTGANRTTWTASIWVKRGAFGNLTNFFTLLGAYDGGSVYASRLYFDTTNALAFDFGGSAANTIATSAVFRDPSSWYHVVLAIDTTQATAANRISIYVNGVLQSTTGTPVAQNTNTQFWITTIPTYIGVRNADNFDGYLAEINVVNGQSLAATNFGAYDATTGVWQPKQYTGTYGSFGFYLKFASFGTTAALGTDSSGNGNTFTVTNVSVTAGTTYDPMLDSPTLTSATVANYAVLNPLQNVAGCQISSGNLNIIGPGTAVWGSLISTIAPTSGKWYFEITPTSGSATSGVMFGITKKANPGTYLGDDSNGYSYYGATGNKFNAGSGTAYGATVADNDIVGVAFDADAGSLTFYKNGTSQGVAFSSLTAGTWYFGVSCYDAASASINFGQRPFSYTPPTGYVRLNAYNLPTPTIANGATVMAATTYTGTGATQSINDGSNTTTSVTFQPDLVWIKSRSAATSNNLFDSLRTATNYLISNGTAANATNANTLTAFNSNGFALGTDASSIGVNISTNTYVAWQWLAGAGSSSSNTSGSITSTVSANTTAGFSVVTFTTQSTGTATVGHGLNAVPSLIITKARAAVSNWVTYHASLGNTGYIYLSTFGAFVADATVWNNTTPTSTVITLGSNFAGSFSQVFYCWSEVAGYSAFGSYSGTASTNGPFVYTGFRPRFVMCKSSNATSNWVIFDTSRDTYNSATTFLYPNLAQAEAAHTGIDILSNGFKPYTSATDVNANRTYIYAAFAENPFKYSLAR